MRNVLSKPVLDEPNHPHIVSVIILLYNHTMVPTKALIVRSGISDCHNWHRAQVWWVRLPLNVPIITLFLIGNSTNIIPVL